MSEETEGERMARLAYETYGAQTGGVNYQGLPMPAWEELPLRIQMAWASAAGAVAKEAVAVYEERWHRRRPADFERDRRIGE